MPGGFLQELPDVISSSSMLHDDVAAHTARIKSAARLAVLHVNDNSAIRRAPDQRLDRSVIIGGCRSGNVVQK